jgi:hypothetical protein
MKFQIFGDYGYTSETLLEEFDTLGEAKDWVDGYIQYGDFGGYAAVEVIRFADDGEAITEYLAENHMYEDDGQPSMYEEYQDLYGGDDMFETCSYAEDF